MDREERRIRNSRGQVSLKNKYIIYWLAILGIVVVALMVYAFNSKGDNKNQGKQSNVSNFIISEKDEDSESASSSIGNTLEDTQSDLENNNIESNNQEDNKIETTAPKEEEKTNKDNTSTPVKDEKENKETKVEENSTPTQAEVVKKELVFSKPVEGTIIKEFAKEKLVYSETLKEWITHNGLDIAADKTTVVKVACEGTVKSIKNDPRYGLTVTVAHDQGFETVYSNLLTAEFIVEGETLKAGQSIGTVGNSASFESSDAYHLHFEILKDGEYLDPTIYVKY